MVNNSLNKYKKGMVLIYKGDNNDKFRPAKVIKTYEVEAYLAIDFLFLDDNSYYLYFDFYINYFEIPNEEELEIINLLYQ